MKRWEKIKEALTNPCKITRAKLLFELMEEERKSGAEFFKEYGLPGIVKLAVINNTKELKYRESKDD